MITNEMYWNVLGRIDAESRERMNVREQVIRSEVPYNPLQIMREASRIAKIAGVPEAERWSISDDGAQLGSDYNSKNFYVQRPTSQTGSDSDKYCALLILAEVCEYLQKRKVG